MARYIDIWPIIRTSSDPPKGWKGWPDGKSFAFVLTHDVELGRGQDKCKKLLEIEKDLGFKSSFNFVPERYQVDRELREFIVSEGFEVGVHGLNHDGKLFKSKSIFLERAKKINHYLDTWQAVGFRAPAMHHNLKWISELNLEYDLSTFDTDPFEPQSDGVSTIFPFWVSGDGGRNGFIELPYTLVQDFTLFILLMEKDINIWKTKIDWIVEHNGMILVNVHPDYINFNDSICSNEEFSINYYRELLFYIKNQYKEKYWNGLPKEIAMYAKQFLMDS